MSADFAAWRRRFPTLLERTYLATQCLGPLPAEALDDLDEYRRTLMLRNRSLGLWLERMDELIGLVEQLLHAPAGSVALRDSATAAQAAVAAALTPTAVRNRILITTLDFHSSRYLWSAQAQRGFSLVEVRAVDGAVAAQRLVERIDERTAVVAVSLVSPRSGALLDVAPVIRRARAAGALVIVDAYQAVGALPIDVRTLDADVVVGGTHKWLCGGGTGLAFLYVRPELANQLQPAYPGWIGHRQLLGFEGAFEPAPGARRFQQGTPALEPIYTARAGLRYVLDVGAEAIRARSLQLTARLLDGAAAAGLAVNTPRESRGGTVCFNVEEPAATVDALAAEGIDVDSRPGAGLRVSPHACNTEEECDRLLAALAKRMRR